MTTTGPLSSAQVDNFVERGWTVLSHGFPATVAREVRRELGKRIGIDLDRPDEWTQPRIWLKETMNEPPYTEALTDRFSSAVDQLVGHGRWELQRYMGWWPVTFPGFPDPPYGDDWHVEGNFRHHVWSPEQAVVNLFCFSTVEPKGGGTLLVEGSHLLVGHLLWEAEPEGLDAEQIWPEIRKLLDAADWPGVVEVTAEEGDVVLAHPLLFHSANPNLGSRPRVMSQPRFDMTEPKRTEGSQLSPVEIPIARMRP